MSRRCVSPSAADFSKSRGSAAARRAASGATARSTSASSISSARQSAGFTLAEIGDLTALDATEDREEGRRLATARLKALDATITELQRARHASKHLVGACAASAAGPCPIIDAFNGEAERTPDVRGRS